MHDKKVFELLLRNYKFTEKTYREICYYKSNKWNRRKLGNDRKKFDVAYNKLKEEYSLVDEKIKDGTASDKDFPNWVFHGQYQGYKAKGIFSCYSLYSYTTWTIDLIEKYKEEIDWLLLIEESDYIFDINDLLKYDDFIPWCRVINGEKSYKPISRDPKGKIRYNEGTYYTIFDFSYINNISEEFILSHISVIDETGFWSTAKIKLTNKIIDFILQYYRDNYWKVFSLMEDNPNITIDINTVKYLYLKDKYQCFKMLQRVALEVDDLLFFVRDDFDCLKYFCDYDFEKRYQITNMILNNKELYDIIGEHITKIIFQGNEGTRFIYRYFYTSEEPDDNSFPPIEYENSDIQWPHVGFIKQKLPYIYDMLSPENIDKFRDLFDNDIITEYRGMRRTPDTNYHMYSRFSLWERIADLDCFRLTYRLYKYFESNSIKIGGSYIMEDDSYKTNEIRDSYVSGMVLFQKCKVINNSELKLIVNDDMLLSKFFINEDKLIDKYYNWRKPVLEELMEQFFYDYSFNRFSKLYSEIKNN